MAADQNIQNAAVTPRDTTWQRKVLPQHFTADRV
jgi:hypothetical protein